MEALLEFMSGPLFRFALTVCILGCVLQFAQNAIVVASSKGLGSEGLSEAFRAVFRWLSPSHRVQRIGAVREILTWLSIAGLVLVPLFYLGHARLWGRYLDLGWPAIDPAVSDLLTKATMVTLTLLLIATVADKRERLTRLKADWLPLPLGLVAFVTGYLVAHPGRSPISPDMTALLHYMSADALLLAIPFTRFARAVLIPEAFDRAVEHRTHEHTREVGA